MPPRIAALPSSFLDFAKALRCRRGGRSLFAAPRARSAGSCPPCVSARRSDRFRSYWIQAFSRSETAPFVFLALLLLSVPEVVELRTFVAFDGLGDAQAETGSQVSDSSPSSSAERPPNFAEYRRRSPDRRAEAWWRYNR